MSENKYYKQIAIASVEQLCKLLGSCYAYYKVEKTKEGEYLVQDQLKQVKTNIENYISHSCDETNDRK